MYSWDLLFLLGFSADFFKLIRAVIINTRPLNAALFLWSEQRIDKLYLFGTLQVKFSELT